MKAWTADFTPEKETAASLQIFFSTQAENIIFTVILKSVAILWTPRSDPGLK